MIESIEFRIGEERAAGRLPESLGQSLGGSVRRVILLLDDPWVARIGEWDQEVRRREHMSFFTSWMIRRRYNAAELRSAKRFFLKWTPVFEPSGEEAGTQYDWSGACELCGAGRRRLGPLILDRKVLRRRSDLAVSIAGDEWMVSAKLAAALREHAISGIRLEPIQFARSRTVSTVDRLFSLDIQPPRVRVATDTKFGLNPFDPDRSGQFRCPKGHCAGLNILSELYLSDLPEDLPDVAMTSVFVGNRAGVLVPYRMITASPRFIDLLRAMRVRGLTIEVVRHGTAPPFEITGVGRRQAFEDA